MDKIGYQEEEIADEGEETHHQDENDHQNEPTESRARLSNIHEPDDIEEERRTRILTVLTVEIIRLN